MSTTHNIKIWPEFFGPVFDGRMNFQLRFNDRNYCADDIVILNEWEPNTAKFSGRKVRKRITFVLEGIGTGAIPPLAGLHRKYVVLALVDP